MTSASRLVRSAGRLLLLALRPAAHRIQQGSDRHSVEPAGLGHGEKLLGSLLRSERGPVGSVLEHRVVAVGGRHDRALKIGFFHLTVITGTIGALVVRRSQLGIAVQGR